MKILVTLGSYRRNGGNTAGLLDLLLEELKLLGADCEQIWLPGLAIGGCRGCNRCLRGDFTQTDRRCAVDDDMRGLYPAVERADAIVVATPVYMWNVSAQTKCFLDRMYPYSHGGLEGKRLAGVFTAGGDAFSGLDLCVQTLTRFARHMGMDYRGTLYRAPCRAGSDPRADPLPALAKELAEKLARAV